jgi:hypothetical protein
MVSLGKLAVAVIYDVVDALNIIPGIGDIIEAVLGGSIAYILTENPKAIAASAVDGILPPPFDLFPTTTVAVILDELGWLD